MRTLLHAISRPFLIAAALFSNLFLRTMGFLGLGYRRPAAQSEGSHNSQESLESFNDDSWRTVQSFSPTGIPEALSFDRIIEGGTCPVRPIPPTSEPILEQTSLRWRRSPVRSGTF